MWNRRRAIMAAMAVMVTTNMAVAGGHEWRGPYIGLAAGFSRGAAKSEIHSSPAFGGFGSDFGASVTNPLDGGSGTLFAGHNWVIGDLVIGIEADGSLGASGYKSGDAIFRQTIEVNRLGTLRTRVGFATSRALLYLTAGASMADAAFTSDSFCPPISPFLGCQSHHRKNRKLFSGFVIGAGIETPITATLNLRGEVIHHSLFGELSSPANQFSLFNTDLVRADLLTVRVGLSAGF